MKCLVRTITLERNVYSLQVCNIMACLLIITLTRSFEGRGHTYKSYGHSMKMLIFSAFDSSYEAKRANRGQKANLNLKL